METSRWWWTLIPVKIHIAPLVYLLFAHCEQHRDNLQTGLDHGVGAFVPQCEADGRYRPLQCHGSTGHCWCVDGTGQERPGTRTSPGSPPCMFKNVLKE
uniref:Thyroglobulin type-1 domain-containing protein n=1 Tax=Periophthalmus magnuspinnatus TaxID=409849 RepID=A0A3B4ADR7_9GOBI